MAGGIFFNNVAQSSLFYNGAEQRECYFNNVLNWKKELQVFPGSPIANAVNIGSYKPYWTYSNDGSKIHVESYGGTDAGDGFIAIGPFSSVGYSQCYFHNLALDVFVNNNVNAKVGLGDINGNFVQVLVDTAYANVLGSGSVFNINSPNGAYYLIIKTWASADYSGHKVTVDLTGFTLR